MHICIEANTIPITLPMKRLYIMLLCTMMLVVPLYASNEGVEAEGGVSQFPASGITLKLNGAYAVVGVINPQVEFRLSPHSAFQTEIVYSPWRSIDGYHMHFGIFLNEYRYYISERTKGLYVGAHAGMMAFDMSKPYLNNGALDFQKRYCKGHGFILGAVVGYEWRFARRWMLDAYAGFGYMHSKYVGYSMDGVVDMYPHRPPHKQPASPDPLNASAEWLPTKIGLSIGLLLWSK